MDEEASYEFSIPDVNVINLSR